MPKRTDFGVLGMDRKIILSCGADRWLHSAPNTNSECGPVTQEAAGGFIVSLPPNFPTKVVFS